MPHMTQIDFYMNNYFSVPTDVFYNNNIKGAWSCSDARKHYYHALDTHDIAVELFNLNHPKTLAAHNRIDQLLKELDDWDKWVDEIEAAKLNQPEDISWCVYPPYAHQREAINIMMQVPHIFLDADCGTGKTYMSINTIIGLKRKGLGHKTLVLCPRSLITNAWIPDCEKFGDLKCQNLRQDRTPIPGNDVYILNYDYLNREEWVEKLLAEKFDIIVLDESTMIKSHEGKRAINVARLAHTIKHRWLLSGSPMPNGIVDLWMQFWTLDGTGATLSNDFFDFRRKTHKEIEYNGSHFFKVTKAGIDKTKQRVNPVMLRYRKEDCLDLPAKIFKTIYVDLSPEQLKVYNELGNDYIAWLESEERVKAQNILAGTTKLLQLTGGWIITSEEDKSIYAFKENPKMDALVDLLEGIGGDQVIIWAWYIHEIEAISERLKCPYINGNVLSDKKRFKIMQDFKTGKNPYLIAHSQTIGHGNTIVNARYMIYYSKNHNYELYHQTQERIHRIGQGNECMYFNLVARDSIDETVQESLENKGDIQNYVTNPRLVLGAAYKGDKNGKPRKNGRTRV